MDSASGGCDEGYSTDIGVEGSACDMEVSPGMTKYWRPNCAESLKPNVVCSRDGFEQSSSSTFSSTQSTVVKRRRVTNRVGCKAKVLFKVRNTPQILEPKIDALTFAMERIAIGAFSTSLATFNSLVAIVLVWLLYHEEENWSSIELVRALHPHLLAIDQCIDHHLTPIQIWPRTAATSSAVIWIVCPFWSCNVQLLGSKFSTNHSPIWCGKLVICHHHLPSWFHPQHPFALGCQPPLLGQVVLLQSALGGAAVLVQWVAPLVALVLAL
nr:protein FAR1-RELATED SEQUENCE 5-like [Ipomoea batatas]